MAIKRPNFVILILIVANLAFLGFVGNLWLQSYTGTDMSTASMGGESVDKSAGVKAVTKRALSVHLPLGGMDGADPTERDNCMRLKGFLLDATHHLANEGKDPPLSRGEITTLVAAGSCSVTDAPVREVIASYAEIWIGAGLPEIGPFTKR